MDFKRFTRFSGYCRRVSLRLAAAVLSCAGAFLCADACTSAIVSGRLVGDGRQLMWKHRDSGFKDNFVDRVEASDSTMAYVALFNAGDSARSEAWIGFNSAGFAVMNTASYNLAPDTASVKDREGLIMSMALAVCRTVADFRSLLERESAKGPLGVQANFGVMDAGGEAGYFETWDHGFRYYPLSEGKDGYLVRSNYSYSGGMEGRLGMVRHDNAVRLTDEASASGMLSAETFTEGMSRSFFHAEHGRNMLDAGYRWLTDRGEYIPRRSSCASVVIEGPAEGETPAEGMVMWVSVGFPALSHVEAVTLHSVPEGLLPTGPDGHSPVCDEANARRDKAFPRKGREGKWLIDVDYVKRVMQEQKSISAERYAEGRKVRAARLCRDGKMSADGSSSRPDGALSVSDKN